MSVLNTLPAPIIQMGVVAKIVNQQQNQPYALNQATQEASRELLKAESLRIAETEPSQRSRKVRDQDEKERNQGQGKKSAGHHPKQKSAEQLPPGDSESGPDRSSLWAGNIVNVKI